MTVLNEAGDFAKHDIPSLTLDEGTYYFATELYENDSCSKPFDGIYKFIDPSLILNISGCISDTNQSTGFPGNADDWGFGVFWVK